MDSCITTPFCVTCISPSACQGIFKKQNVTGIAIDHIQNTKEIVTLDATRVSRFRCLAVYNLTQIAKIFLMGEALLKINILDLESLATSFDWLSCASFRSAPSGL